MKKQNYRSKSQNKNFNNFQKDISVTVLLSENNQFSVEVSTDTTLVLLKSLLFQKIKQIQQRQILSFEAVPNDYLFDYRFSKNIGVLGCEQKGNLTLKCLYKTSITNLNQQEKYPQHKIQESLKSPLQKICKYKICKPLSSGGFSRVYLVRNLENGQFYAGKFMDKSSQVNKDRQEAIRNEFFIHKSLNHPYIVKMEEFIETQNFYILILEYCPGGQLFTVLKNNRYMGEEKAKIIFIQVLLALQYLHQRNIVFRDIKPQNILIDSKGNAKLTDFGLAKQIRGKTNSYCGSVEYMAPQIVSKQHYSFDVDLYCMGALLYEILIGCPPFYNPNFSNNQTKYHICNSQASFPTKIQLSNKVKDLISNLLIKNPNERLGHFQGVQEILQHEWIGPFSRQLYLKQKIKNPFVPHLDIQNFDRQEDQYERNFRKKILEDIRNIKRIYYTEKLQEQKKNSHLKSKSQSVSVLQQKYSKQNYQQQFKSSLFSNKKLFEFFKIKNFSKKLLPSKQNPYALEIKNKSISQMYYGTKDKKTQILKESNGFKKKKQQRTLSRSLKKAASSLIKYSKDPQNEGKNHQSNLSLTNSLSCGISRKESLHKISSQGNFSKFANLTSYKFKLQPQKTNHTYTKSVIDNFNHESLNQKSFQKNRKSVLSKQENLGTKEFKEKQNFESKGLRKNAVKKKFMFGSTKQSSSGFVKTDNIMFQVNKSPDSKNPKHRQTLF